MTAAPGGGSSGGEVEVDLEYLRDIATRVKGELERVADQGTQKFRNSKLDASLYSDVPLAQEFAAQSEAAHDVFVKTIEGIKADLVAFGVNLSQAVDNHQNSEDAVGAAMAALNAEYVPEPTGGGAPPVWEHEQQFDDSRSEHEDLDVPADSPGNFEGQSSDEAPPDEGGVSYSDDRDEAAPPADQGGEVTYAASGSDG